MTLFSAKQPARIGSEPGHHLPLVAHFAPASSTPKEMPLMINRRFSSLARSNAYLNSPGMNHRMAAGSQPSSGSCWAGAVPPRRLSSSAVGMVARRAVMAGSASKQYYLHAAAVDCAMSEKPQARQ